MASIRVLLHVCTPVSYTHLDVYKRQLLDSVKMLPFLFAAYWLIEYVEHLSLIHISGEAVLGPVQQTDASYTQPSASLVALPEAGLVEMSYFDDALFVGDSLTRGFQEYSLSLIHIFCVIGAFRGLFGRQESGAAALPCCSTNWEQLRRFHLYRHFST